MAKSVTVLKGGWSAEREVSLVSGRECAKALKEQGFTVTEIDVTADLKKFLNEMSAKPDVVFNALHGKGGEDGCIQGILDVLGVAYTHSGRVASAIAMNKFKTKELVKPLGMPCAEGKLVPIAELAKKDPFERPYVVKPNCEGSSVGVYIVKKGDNRNIEAEWVYGDEALVEKYIPGRELSVGVMKSKDGAAKALTVTEIVPTNIEFYNYEAKYADGGSTHVVPAKIPDDVFDEAKRLAALAHETLGCEGVSRSDFRYDDSKPGVSGLYFLEINTQPGMTPTSLVPEQAKHLGISFGQLVEWMVENAQCHGD